jgi:dephospho-CoA kinase
LCVCSYAFLLNGSGKSTTTAILKEKNIPVIDADEIAREGMETDKYYQSLCATYDSALLNGHLRMCSDAVWEKAQP